jgi:thiol-disulfide isomerase/thioredoxin
MISEQSSQRVRIWTMKRLAFALVVFVVLTVACNNEANYEGTTNAPTTKATPNRAGTPTQTQTAAQMLPDNVRQTELKTIDGKPLKLADYAGKVVVLDVWATWCGPCRLEIPELIQLHQDYNKRGVEVVGLAYETQNNQTPENEAKVRSFANQFKINYTVGLASDELAGSLLLPSGSIPQTYVISQDGHIIGHYRGYSPAVGAQLRQWVDQALAGT